MSFIMYILWKKIREHRESRRKNKEHDTLTDASEQTNPSLFTSVFGDDTKEDKGLELLLFRYDVVAAATNHFASENMLGKGGFGPVYRGKLSEGDEIAVKRLWKGSGQGLKEFKNEILLISKLQHRNLVRLLGCCIYGEEKLLLYEFMPNKSLDFFIFNPTYHGVLDWARRFHILEGIARGLLYLHRDSRLRIIHRDLKASNILLDEQFDPKISDFGMAKIVYGDESLDTTRRVVGTIGYMSPEYVIEGKYSEKSDVFSYGVLLLEVLSGKRNNAFHDEESSLYLLGYAWKLWKENRVLELIDPSIGGSYSSVELFRCINVGLLCVEEYPEDRPNMASVVLMLSSDINLPAPNQVAFSRRRSPTNFTLSSMEQNESNSLNYLTFTELGSR